MAGCLSDLYLRALRVLRGSNLAFLCALRVSVVGKRIFSTLASTVCGAKGIGVFGNSDLECKLAICGSVVRLPS